MKKPPGGGSLSGYYASFNETLAHLLNLISAKLTEDKARIDHVIGRDEKVPTPKQVFAAPPIQGESSGLMQPDRASTVHGFNYKITAHVLGSILSGRVRNDNRPISDAGAIFFMDKCMPHQCRARDRTWRARFLIPRPSTPDNFAGVRQ